MIGHNTNSIVVSEVIDALWMNWLGEKGMEADEEDPNENSPLNHEPKTPPPYIRPTIKPPLPPKPSPASMTPTAPPSPEDFPDEKSPLD